VNFCAQRCSLGASTTKNQGAALSSAPFIWPAVANRRSLGALDKAARRQRFGVRLRLVPTAQRGSALPLLQTKMVAQPMWTLCGIMGSKPANYRLSEP